MIDKTRIFTAILIVILTFNIMGFITRDIIKLLLLTMVETTYVFLNEKGFLYYHWNWLNWDKKYINYWEMFK